MVQSGDLDIKIVKFVKSKYFLLHFFGILLLIKKYKNLAKKIIKLEPVLLFVRSYFISGKLFCLFIFGFFRPASLILVRILILQ